MEAIHGMKIYAMGDDDWYVAPTMQEALAEYCAEMCATEQELRDDGQLPSGYRVKYASVLAHCDKLRELYLLPPRHHKSTRVPDRDILPFPYDETVFVKDVMSALDVSQFVVLNLIEDGTLAAYQLMPNTKTTWRIHRPSLVRHLEQIRRDAGAPTQSEPVSATRCIH